MVNIIKKSIFFRTCPFVKLRIDCTLPKKYRCYACNLFICDEILKKVEEQDEFKNLNLIVVIDEFDDNIKTKIVYVNKKKHSLFK